MENTNENTNENTDLDDLKEINFNKYLKGPDTIISNAEKFILKHKITMSSLRVDGKKIVKLIISQILNDIIENCLKMNSFYKIDKNYVLKNKEITEVVLKKAIVYSSKEEIISLIKLYKKTILLKFSSDLRKTQQQENRDRIKNNTDKLAIIDASLNYLKPIFRRETSFRMEQLSRQGEIKAEMYKNLNQLNMDEFGKLDEWGEIIEKNLDLRKVYQETLEQIEDNKEFIQHQADNEDRTYKELERDYKKTLKDRENQRKDLEYGLLTKKMNKENVESLNEASQQIHDKLIAAQNEATETVVSSIKTSFDKLDKGIDKIDTSIGKVDASVDKVRTSIGDLNKSIVEGADKTIAAINGVNTEVQKVTESVNKLTSKIGDVITEVGNLGKNVSSAISKTNVQPGQQQPYGNPFGSSQPSGNPFYFPTQTKHSGSSSQSSSVNPFSFPTTQTKPLGSSPQPASAPQQPGIYPMYVGKTWNYYNPTFNVSDPNDQKIYELANEIDSYYHNMEDVLRSELPMGINTFANMSQNDFNAAKNIWDDLSTFAIKSKNKYSLDKPAFQLNYANNPSGATSIVLNELLPYVENINDFYDKFALLKSMIP